MTTIVNLKDLETKVRLTTNEMVDLIYCRRIESMKLNLMPEKDRKDSYLSYSRCLKSKEKNL